MTLFTPYSGQNVKWICSNNKNHIWSCNISNRTSNKTGCPHCCKSKNYSEAQLKWINIISQTYNVEIRTILSPEGEYSVKSPNKGTYKLDGYFKIYKGEVLLEYNGCYWHGCTKCHKSKELNLSVNKIFGQLREETRNKKRYLQSLGFCVITMWDASLTRKNLKKMC